VWSGCDEFAELVERVALVEPIVNVERVVPVWIQIDDAHLCIGEGSANHFGALARCLAPRRVAVSDDDEIFATAQLVQVRRRDLRVRAAGDGRHGGSDLGVPKRGSNSVRFPFTFDKDHGLAAFDAWAQFVEEIKRQRRAIKSWDVRIALVAVLHE